MIKIKSLRPIFLLVVFLASANQPVAAAPPGSFPVCYWTQDFPQQNIVIFCGPPDVMAREIVALWQRVANLVNDDGRVFTLVNYDGYGGTVFSVHVMACTSSSGCWGTGGGLSWWCPPGYSIAGTETVCSLVVDNDPMKTAGPSCNEGDSEAEFGNPCNAASRNKYQIETDFASSSATPLLYQRHYNSLIADFRFSGSPPVTNWKETYDRSLKMIQGTPSAVFVHRETGQTFVYTQDGNGAFVAPADIRGSLQQTSDGWIYGLPDGTIERYDANGILLSITDRNGLLQSLSYDSTGHLLAVTDSFGHSLTFSYDTNDRLIGLTDSNGAVTTYSYDSANNITQVIYPDGTGKIYHYENTNYYFRHLLTGVSYLDALGNAERYSNYFYDYSNFNSPGQVLSSEHAGGVQRFSFSYDSNSQTTVTDTVNTRQLMSFQPNLGVKKPISRVNQADGKSLNQVFDVQNNLTCKRDEEGRVTTYTYNATNQKLSTTEGLSGSCAAPQTTNATRTTTYQYLSPTLNLPTLISSPSVAAGQTKTTTIQYGDATHPNLPTSITQSGYTPSGSSVSRAVTLSYNSFGQVNRIDGPRTDVNDITTLAYNSCTTGGGCGQLSSMTNALGQVTTFDSYDANGRLTQMTDPNGLRTSYLYDARGRVSRITQTPPTGAARVTQYSYTAAGDIASVAFLDGRQLVYAYDAARLLRQVTDNLGNQVRYGYDLKGNRTQEYTYDPSNTLVRQIDYAFDLRNYLSGINTGGSLTQQIHDAVGNLTQQTDPKNNLPTTNSYDALNRLLQTLNALGGNTGYGYNVQDKLTQVSTPNGVTTQYLYDDLGNLLQESSPDRGTTTYTYDNAGNLTSQTDARGITTAYTYDALNRVTTIRYNPGLFSSSPEDVTYTYDTGANCTAGIGRLCQVTDASGTTQYAYDSFGNITIEARTELNIIYTTRYSYDAADRITSLTYPDGRIVTYTRDALGRIQSVNATVNNANQAIVSNRSYRADGLLTGQSFANGLTETRQYDLQGRLVNQFVGSADTRVYSYDPNGNLTQEQALAQVGAYSYDALDRLTQETLTSTTTDTNAYTYDPNGNRLSDLNANGTPRSYSYDPGSNRLNQRGNQSFVMDAMGNTVSDRNTNRSFSYTNAGRLSQVTISGVIKGTYTYNAMGQRTEKVRTTNTGATKSFVYHYDIQGNLISETKPDGTPIRAYIWADTQPLAQIQYKSATPHDTLVYLHTDHLTTPRLATDSTQTVIWRWESEAFGTGRPDTDPDADDTKTNVRLRLPGQYADGESGLYYNWNRYYDPKLGRYITSDPIGLDGGLNTYAYVDANPSRFIDPSGFSAVVINIDRSSGSANATMGRITASGTNVGCSLELPWKDNKNDVSSIVPGTYNAQLRVRPNGTRAIQLERVPSRTDVQIHPANYPSELKGCIAPGKTCGNDSVGDSQKAMKQILDIIDFARNVDAVSGDPTDIVVRIR